MSAVISGESGFRHLLETKLGKRNLTLDLLGNAMEDRNGTRQLKSVFIVEKDWINYSNRF